MRCIDIGRMSGTTGVLLENTVKNTTFDSNFITFNLNVTTFGVLIDNFDIAKPNIFWILWKYFGR